MILKPQTESFWTLCENHLNTQSQSFPVLVLVLKYSLLHYWATYKTGPH